MNAQILYHWSKEVSRQFSGLSRPQTKGLAAFSLGIALARRCSLGLVAERLWMVGKADSVERRLQRFLANTNLICEEVCTALAKWVLSALVFSGNILVLLVDETSLRDKLQVMAVCLAYRGRAIPLAWKCYRPDKWPCSQLELIERLLSWVAPAVPAGMQVLVEVDRGLSSAELMKAVERRGWHYLFRVQKSVQLRIGEHVIPFDQTITRMGDRWAGWVHAYKTAGSMRCWAIAYWGRSHQEPWFLLTNCPRAQGQWYGWRMWEELCFRDLKSGGWHWQRSRVWLPEHAERLWLLMALAYVWMLSLGTQAVQWVTVKSQVLRGRTWRKSLFQIGLRVLMRLHVLKLPCPYKLMFISHANV